MDLNSEIERASIGISYGAPGGESRAGFGGLSSGIFGGVKESKGWKDECGVFAIWNHPQASQISYLGLFSMQHRGQESAGLVTLQADGTHLHHKGLGLVSEVFNETNLNRISGHAAIGHVRYSTTGQNLIANAQPLTANLINGSVAVAHNGNLINYRALKQELQKSGAIFQGSSDTEVVLHFLSRHPSDDFVTALADILPRLDGAYSMVLMSDSQVVVARDPYGFRPLVMGRMKYEDAKGETQESYVFASETCAFDLIGAEYIREVAPGELVVVDKQGLRSQTFQKAPRRAHCVFEHVYFARPDSLVFDRSVYEARKAFGKQLAKEFSVDADLVIPVPDSGVAAAIGYAQESGIDFELGIIRNHYIGRTFIQPTQDIRDFGVRIKLNPQSSVLKGKRVIVIDDSLVRGTTSRKIVGLIRQAGAKEVHIRIAAPPTVGPCFYGVDTPMKSQLIASRYTCEEICKFIEADSLKYLSIAGMFKALEKSSQDFCAACFDGKYPTDLHEFAKEV